MSPVTRTVQTGECWALNDGTALNRPLPGQQPTSTTLRDRVRDGRPTNPTAVEGHSRDVLQPRTRTGRQGRAPAGTSSARPPPGAKERRRRTTNGQGGGGKTGKGLRRAPVRPGIQYPGWAGPLLVYSRLPPLSFHAGTAPPSLQCGRRLSLGQWVRTRQPRPGTWTPGRPGSVLLAPCVRGFARRYHLNRWAAHIRQRACASLTLCTR